MPYATWNGRFLALTACKLQRLWHLQRRAHVPDYAAACAEVVATEWHQSQTLEHIGPILKQKVTPGTVQKLRQEIREVIQNLVKASNT